MDQIVIGGGDYIGDYQDTEWGGMFATVKVKVTGDFASKTVDRTLGSITTKHIGGGSGKMNLITMLVPKEKSRLMDNERISYLSKKKINKYNENSKLNEEQHIEGDEPNNNLITGIEPNTKNIFIFDK